MPASHVGGTVQVLMALLPPGLLLLYLGSIWILVGHQDGVLGSWLWTDPDLAAAVILEVSQQRHTEKDLSIHLAFHPSIMVHWFTPQEPSLHRAGLGQS